MNRYVRQEVLKEIGKEGQKKISRAKIAIIGMGALGSHVAELLVRAGIGKLILFDADKIDITNIQRQSLFGEKDVGKNKVDVASKKLLSINENVKIICVREYLEASNTKVLKDYDLILDCTDNMRARWTINDYCQKNKKLWIYSACVGTKGNVLVVNNHDKFRKTFMSSEDFDVCSNIGVLNSAVSMAASIQATEAIKIILGKKYCKDMMRFDVWNYSIEKIKF